jgi:hypothetical protein
MRLCQIRSHEGEVPLKNNHQRSTRQWKLTQPQSLKWSALLLEAVTKPGLINEGVRCLLFLFDDDQLLALLQFERRITARANQHFAQVERAWLTR